MAAQGSAPDSVGDRIGVILFGLVIVIPGLILTTNYRKLADRNLAMTHRFMDSVGLVSPWRRRHPANPSNHQSGCATSSGSSHGTGNSELR